MATPSKAGKELLQYNCKNGVYSIDGETIKPLGYLTAITLEADIDTKPIYGDGEEQLSLIRDKGLTGTLEMTAHDEDFEKDLGFLQETKNGLARIQVLENKSISIGFETSSTNADGVTKTKKVWLYNVKVTPAGESLNQNTDSINENAASYGMTVRGVNLKAADGTSDYVDANGNTHKIFKERSIPSETNYATFLDSVSVPTEKTAE